MDAIAAVESEVRDLIRRSDVDPVQETERVREMVERVVTDYDQRSIAAGRASLGDLSGAVKSVLDTVAGFGPLQEYLDDPEIEEVWINSPCITT